MSWGPWWSVGGRATIVIGGACGRGHARWVGGWRRERAEVVRPDSSILTMPGRKVAASEASALRGAARRPRYCGGGHEAARAGDRGCGGPRRMGWEEHGKAQQAFRHDPEIWVLLATGGASERGRTCSGRT